MVKKVQGVLFDSHIPLKPREAPEELYIAPTGLEKAVLHLAQSTHAVFAGRNRLGGYWEFLVGFYELQRLSVHQPSISHSAGAARPEETQG